MLPREFLCEIAEKYGLSNKEQEVFLKKFGSDKTDREIADELHIADGTFRTRMSGVYRKFGYHKEKGPVKSDLLFRFLTKEYRKINLLLNFKTNNYEQETHDNSENSVNQINKLDVRDKLEKMSVKFLDIFENLSCRSQYRLQSVSQSIINNNKSYIDYIEQLHKDVSFCKRAASWLDDDRIEELAKIAAEEALVESNSLTNTKKQCVLLFTADIGYYLRWVRCVLNDFDTDQIYDMETYQNLPLRFYIKALESIKISSHLQVLPVEVSTKIKLSLNCLIDVLSYKLS
jgi:hypothetical protein